MTTGNLMFAFEKAHQRLELIEKFKHVISETFDLAVLIAGDREEVSYVDGLRAFALASLETELRAARAK